MKSRKTSNQLYFVSLFVYTVFAVSIYEYVIHRFISHAEEQLHPKLFSIVSLFDTTSKYHTLHHGAKDPPHGNMSSNNDRCSLLIETGQSIKLYVVGLISIGGAGLLIGFKMKHLLISCTIAMFYVLITWNTFHTLSHGALREDYSKCSKIVSPCPLYKQLHPFPHFMKNNHLKHHLSKGTTHFNTTVPLIGDTIFRTI